MLLCMIELICAKRILQVSLVTFLWYICTLKRQRFALGRVKAVHHWFPTLTNPIVFHRPWHSDAQVQIPPQGCSPLCSPITTSTDFFHSDTHSVWCCSGCQMGGSLHCAALEQTIQQRSFSRDSQHSKEGASCQRIYWYQVIRSCVQKTRKYTVSRNVLNLV